MWEPRGHADMYGALPVPTTELTHSGEADIGVLFMHNGTPGLCFLPSLGCDVTTQLLEGYSSMCGHATIALGRFLIDTQDKSIFPQRDSLQYDAARRETYLRLHAPCGVVRVTVPTILEGDRPRSDATRPVTFISVPSFVSARDVMVDIPDADRWAALGATGRGQVRVDIAYGGAFYAIVDVRDLGFTGLVGHGYTLREFDEATATVKKLLAGRHELLKHPSEPDLEYLYGVIVVDESYGGASESVGLCFFANQEVDRSPTGSGVSARVALEVARGRRGLGETAVFHSPVSLGSDDGFTGTAVEQVVLADGRVAVSVAVGGRGWYTGAHAFVAEGAEAEKGKGVAGFLLRDCL